MIHPDFYKLTPEQRATLERQYDGWIPHEAILSYLMQNKEPLKEPLIDEALK